MILSDMNKKWEDWAGEVLVLHEGTERNQAFGRNLAYKNTFINNKPIELNRDKI